jgi:hypothetical protein
MKKLVLIAAAAAALAASAITPASAGFKGCCGGWNPGGLHHHWHGGFGGGLSIGLVGYEGGGDCYYVRRNVLVPNIGIVSRRELVCG